MRNAEADPLKLIIAAVILLITMVIILVIFRSGFSKEANVTSGNIDKLNTDSDGDGVMDYFDYCPYNSNYAKKQDTPNGKIDDCKPCTSLATKC